MKTVISAKIKLNTTPKQFEQLRATQLAYRDALNFVSKYAFEHGKTSNRVALQDGTYDDIRARFHLPLKWPVAFLARSEPLTKVSGPRSRKMLLTASLAGPRNAIEAWIKRPSTFPPR
jgi:predicted transposase